LLVQRQVGHDAFQPGILVLKHLQPPQLGYTQVTVFLLPGVVKVASDTPIWRQTSTTGVPDSASRNAYAITSPSSPVGLTEKLPYLPFESVRVWGRRQDHLIKLTAQRCVDPVRDGKLVNLAPEDALMDYNAFLRQADHITQDDRRRAEARFEESMARQFGTPHNVYETHDAWERNSRTKRGQRWIDAQSVATGDALVGIGGVEGANFETEFLYDL